MNENNDDFESIIWSNFRRVTPEVLALFFYERSVPTINCPICKSSDMSIPRATENIGGIEVTYVHPSRVDVFGFEPRKSLLQYHYRLICKNCGYESRFSIQPVFHWLDEKEKNGDKI